ncbi:hypothetical protein GCM10010404_81920 [Nonomuraea africana]|uniref:Uncharacterized protein n=1 Tax=Nonomuraea africana TaxID=46171 RepID=A0ABR9KX04_9ACTN|nr:hypothetical protein [Nonomuraea africana]MBE1566573.1 hypothetical protein [Nonomuraea africana]
MDDVELAALRAQVTTLEAALTVRQRSIPALPRLDGATPITWRRWQAAPLLSHVDSACEQCAHPGPQQITFGLDSRAGRKPVICYQANRCPACQEVRVYRRDEATTGWPRAVLTEIAYHPSRTEEQ